MAGLVPAIYVSKALSWISTGASSVHLAPLAGRGRIVLTIRVRGTLRESERVESPPHPNPLSASGEREQWSIAAALQAKLIPR
jgi:hypothetical protein